MADIQGSYDELFTAVPSVLAGLLDDGDAGASVAVFVDGEPVVDVWGGFAGADRAVPWQRDTITNVWSVTSTGPSQSGRPAVCARRCWCGTCSRTPRACPTGTGRSR